MAAMPTTEQATEVRVMLFVHINDLKHAAFCNGYAKQVVVKVEVVAELYSADLEIKTAFKPWLTTPLLPEELPLVEREASTTVVATSRASTMLRLTIRAIVSGVLIKILLEAAQPMLAGISRRGDLRLPELCAVESCQTATWQACAVAALLCDTKRARTQGT